MTIKEIVTKFLRESDYDGLWNDVGECACTLDDLAPCECDYQGIDSQSCRAGYKAPCDCGEHDFHIQAEKPCHADNGSTSPDAEVDDA